MSVSTDALEYLSVMDVENIQPHSYVTPRMLAKLISHDWGRVVVVSARKEVAATIPHSESQTFTRYAPPKVALCTLRESQGFILQKATCLSKYRGNLLCLEN